MVKELPSMLNYTRSIIPSNGVFFYRDGDSKQEKPIMVQQQTVRGTIANYSGISRDDKKLVDAEKLTKLLDPSNANIQRIDVCYLPNSIDNFCLQFSVTFAAHSLSPGACGDIEYAKQLELFAQSYKDKDGYTELATRYLQNLINARWMWRNRYASNKKVNIYGQKTNHSDKIISVNVENKFDYDYSQVTGYLELRNEIAQALSGAKGVLRLNVFGSGVLGMGQEVYPSQEFVEGKKDKTLASVNLGKDLRQAAMHSQKIGNAIRTIDDWHGRVEEYGQIAVEPYGVVTQRAEAIRLPHGKNDLYSYLKNLDHWVDAIQNATPEKLPNEAHYMMACFIRGGVYSGESKKEKGNKS